jgi:hypothetical protein
MGLAHPLTLHIALRYCLRIKIVLSANFVRQESIPSHFGDTKFSALSLELLGGESIQFLVVYSKLVEC